MHPAARAGFGAKLTWRARCCLQAIALMAAFREEWPCLLVVPSSLREVWADALVEWLGVTERDMLLVNAGKDLEGLRGRLPGLGAAPAALSPSAPGLGRARPLNFVVVSYALVGKLAAVLAGDAADSGSGSSGGGRGRGTRRRSGRGRAPSARSPFGMVVCDESHYLKDYKARATSLPELLMLCLTSQALLRQVHAAAGDREVTVHTSLHAVPLRVASCRLQAWSITHGCCNPSRGCAGAAHQGHAAAAAVRAPRAAADGHACAVAAARAADAGLCTASLTKPLTKHRLKNGHKNSPEGPLTALHALLVMCMSALPRCRVHRSY